MSLDPRRNAVRDDLADGRLADVSPRPRTADQIRRAVAWPLAGCHVRPTADAPLSTQFLYGEPVDVFDTADGFAWVQSAVDAYVGYVREEALGPVATPTHKVAVPLAAMFPEPSIKVPAAAALPMGSTFVACDAATFGTEQFHATAGGYLLAQHVVPLAAVASDWVEVATLFLGTPYLWGGKSWLGIDCSGLVQVALAAAGIAAPRDSDMQEAELGEMVDAPPARGDLVFWRGHVGIMLDPVRLLHSNGHHHLTVVEPLVDTVARHARKGLPVTARRRLTLPGGAA